MILKFYIFFSLLIFAVYDTSIAQSIQDYNVKWTSQSNNSSESMPVGGGDIGVNLWVEKGQVYLYLGKTGAFDENNTLLKLGRIKLDLLPNPFAGKSFSQELVLHKGHATISAEHNGNKVDILVFVDVFRPNIHIEVKSLKNIHLKAAYESWRYKDLFPEKRENNMNSWKWAPPHKVITHKDSIRVVNNEIHFYHQNKSHTVFDIVVKQQKMDSVKDSLYNPLQNLISGGILKGSNLEFVSTTNGKYMDTDYKSWVLSSKKEAKRHNLLVVLFVDKSKDISSWFSKLAERAAYKTSIVEVKKQNEQWWHNFWQRSHIIIRPKEKSAYSEAWQVGRNYQLFRYMLACNAYGDYPTKFNGGLFTYDPSSINNDFKFTPDFRNWGGGTHTAQNQRLVYWPMLKSGDFDMMPSQFKFYQRIQKNAELRSKVYWGHLGASFTEQIENFGLPNPAEYNWKRPESFDPGIEYNAWLEHQWDTVLEFCMMMLELESYNNEDVSAYIPFVMSSIQFFDEHYQFRARQLGNKALNEKGHLIFYPGSSAETYKMAYNASTTIAALQGVTQKLVSLDTSVLKNSDRAYLQNFLKKIPPLPKRILDGKEMLAPAEIWARVNNTEAPQLYGVYPWGFYGVGKPDIDIAINTYKYDTDLLKFRSHVGWKQDNIFAARLGLTDEAKKYTTLKLKDSERRFPTFWGPGFDWVPDHNWGGSGMIGLQEMLLQTNDDKILLFPAWPKDWDVDFKLHASQNATVSGRLIDGVVKDLVVLPKERLKDVQICLN
ncbi:DUF5703 domain-containing protein [Sphingobacterium bovistauri]|uniref:DUF5703 domain-containing protein n=1 Tax=Sphingobacterium bovistauri TaxID=2781959 RepID=A0ABS7Z400_9SPHI|nr:DUF5703 domain-containing protein [Sphingobacterium bovistauri]MCA5004743.1 hypothetical protein [Sphingobacterium bovistauri]